MRSQFGLQRQLFQKLHEENENLRKVLEKQQKEDLNLRRNFDTLLKLLKHEYKRSAELLKKLEEEKEDLRREKESQNRHFIRKQFLFGLVVLLMFGYIAKVF